MLQTITPSRRTWRPALLGGLLLAAGLPLTAAAQRVLWVDATEALPTAARATTQALTQYRSVRVQLPAMRDALATAPAEAGLRTSGTVISLPLPDGTSQRFRVSLVPVMHPDLAARYPQIRTYQAQGIDNPAATARLDVTPAGFHAMIQAPGQTVFIDPAVDGSATHLVFNKSSMNASAQGGFCLTTDTAPVLPAPTAGRFPNGTSLRTYRLAMACTGEYAATKGGTVAGALAGFVASVNRVSGVYEKELAIRLVLVPKTDTLIFLNAATDPYTNISNGATLNTNQTVTDQRIGSANYDIGHVFNTDGGGVAGLGVVCRAGNKARGTTGLANPTGDAFDIDFVAHEIGHQFGGAHTFNGSTGNCAGGNRTANSAYEPGSGTTIMAYAGICSPQNVQNNSDPYFHSHSYDQILTYAAGAGNCSVNTPTGNQAPVVNAGSNYVIPTGTPFELTGSATDPDGDALTYNWEQFDLGPTGAPTAPVGNAPLFRVFAPVTTPTRTFPRLSNLLANTTSLGEILPTYARRMVFRLVARDNRAGGGGSDYDSMNVVVSAVGGPFQVTLPNTSSASWQAGAPQQVTWNVANTTAAPINAANVDILLSTDGGQTFPTVLLANTPNDGYANVTVPTTVAATSSARIKIKASGNIFFDLSNQNFSITNSGAPTFFLSPVASTGILSVCPNAALTFDVNVGQIQSFTGQVALSATNLPTGVTVTYSSATTAAGTTVQANVAVAAGTAAGTYTISLTGTSGSTTQAQQYTFTVLPGATAAAVPVSPVSAQRVGPRPRLTWNAVPNATGYEVQVAADANFSTVLFTQTNVTGTSYTIENPTLVAGTTYYWRVRGTSPCSAAPYSVASSFVVGTLACNTVAATQVPLTLTIGAASSVTSVINVQSTERVGNIRIRNLAITYPNAGELTVSLTNPAGRTVVLLSNSCLGTSNVDVSLSDDATAAITCPINAGATYRPVNSLASLLNDPANGNWTLTVAKSGGNGGQLTGWSLELCTLSETPAAPTSMTAQLNGVTNNRANVDLIWLDNAANETGYEIERTGADNSTYTLVATVPANTTYYADQIGAANGNYCYRVRAVGTAGNSAYSNSACVSITTLGTQNEALLRGVEVYPNPSTGLYQVKMDNAQRGSVTLRVTDALGRTVSSTTLNKAGAPLRHALDLSKLSNGVYQLHLDMPEGTAVVKLLKQ